MREKREKIMRDLCIRILGFSGAVVGAISSSEGGSIEINFQFLIFNAPVLVSEYRFRIMFSVLLSFKSEHLFTNLKSAKL